MLDRVQSASESARLRFSRSSQRSSTYLQAVLTAILRGYKRIISPLLPSACRFHPTCSEYMREAIEIYGPVSGIWLGLKRLGRCHPFHEGGFDPVLHPEAK